MEKNEEIIVALMASLASVTTYALEDPDDYEEITVEDLIPEGASQELINFITLDFNYYENLFGENSPINDIDIYAESLTDKDIDCIVEFINLFKTETQKLKAAYTALSSQDILLYCESIEEETEWFIEYEDEYFKLSEQMIIKIYEPFITMAKDKATLKADDVILSEISELLDDCTQDLTNRYMDSIDDIYFDMLDEYPFYDNDYLFSNIPLMFDLRFSVDKDNITKAQYEDLKQIKQKVASLSDSFETFLQNFGVKLDDFNLQIDQYIKAYEDSIKDDSGKNDNDDNKNPTGNNDQQQDTTNKQPAKSDDNDNPGTGTQSAFPIVMLGVASLAVLVISKKRYVR